MTVSFVVPIRTFSKLNQRIHWAKRARQNKLERQATNLFAGSERWPIPCVITLVRISPRQLDDDNLRGALKAVRDEVAALHGVDDRDPRVEWRYGQEKGKHGVRVEVRPL
jgi:hypothetical protein